MRTYPKKVITRIGGDGLERLQALAILLPVIVALFGAGVSVYNIYAEPDFGHGKYFVYANLEYGEFQNTLHVEVFPTGSGEVILGPLEALLIIKQKAGINNKIDNKPIVVVTETRIESELMPLFKYTVYLDKMGIFEAQNRDERMQKVQRIFLNLQILYKEKDRKSVV